MKRTTTLSRQYLVTDEPYYLPVGKEVALFESAYRHQIPLLLKGPTGCGSD
jgi:nitric oxide reductase NorQ protein